MKTKLLISLLCIVNVISAQDLCTPVGWATQNGGVTGGGSAASVTVTNYNDLKNALTSSSAKVVYISGIINFPTAGRITIQDIDGKTIIGMPGSKLISSDLSKDGSGIFYIKRCTNFIMRNLYFEGPGAYDTDGFDNLCIDDCQNFWVDHCEFHDGMDGNFDIKNMSDFISVTWCTFSYEKAPISGGPGGANDHRYTNLIGSSDGATDDRGKLNTTFQYCWWGNGCRERMPRARYGKIHMVNNLFDSDVSNHCIRAGYEANILVEANYFDNQNEPIDIYNSNAVVTERANEYVNCSGVSQGSTFTPPYSIDVADAVSIVTPIKNCAGATLTDPTGCSSCSGGNKAPVVSISSPANAASFSAPANVSFAVNTSDEDGHVAQVAYYNGTNLIGTAYASPFSYTWNNVSAGSYSLTAVATDNEGKEGSSTAIHIEVVDQNTPTLTVSDNATQGVQPGSAIDAIIFTWGAAATDVSYTSLPNGLSAVKDNGAKTLTISGTPTNDGTFEVSTIGGNSTITLAASVYISTDVVLANWYPFQEDAVSLDFVSYTNASLEPSYYDNTKPDNGVSYTTGALRLNKGTGTLTISLASLKTLAIRTYATGGRTMEVSYGPTGTENVWSTGELYSSGAHEFELTTLIPALVSSTPIVVNIINNRIDGGSFNIHDLFVEGSVDNGVVDQTQTLQLQQGWNLVSLFVSPTDASVETLFANATTIKTPDSFWNAMESNFLNTITTVETGVGYLIYNTQAETLNITGTAVTPVVNPIHSGWNLVGVASTESIPLSAYSDASIIKDFNGFYKPGDAMSSISELLPGKAYYILK